MRTENEVMKEIRAVEEELRRTPKEHSNYGHLLTILTGLKAELRDIRKKGVILTK